MATLRMAPPWAVYLDIETNSFGQVTVVGLYGHDGFTSLVEGELLTRRRLCEELPQYDYDEGAK